MKKTPPPKKPLVHFIGIGGIGMSSLAQWFMAQNWAVTGSDITRSLITHDAAKRGVKVKIGPQKASNLPSRTSLVIRTQAVKPDNPEYAAARHRKVPIMTYPEIVGQLTDEYRTVAVAGAHGKSTTTAFMALLLERAKLDPTVIIGTRLKEFGENNFRPGHGPWLVLEADEYGKAFLNYTPTIAIITNIDKEHLDTYGRLAGVKRAFLTFIGRILPGGALIVNADDKNTVSLKSRTLKIARKNHVEVIWYSRRSPLAAKLRKVLKIPGEHNVSNALAAMAAAKLFHIPEKNALVTLGIYRGSWRRFDRRGSFRDAIVFDDYAHHPTEIKATLRGFRARFPKKKIVCVYEPHQAERLRRLWPEFQTCFDLADELVMLPIYRVAGRDNREHPTYNSRNLAALVAKRNPKKTVRYLPDYRKLGKTLVALSPAPLRDKVIVMMGAGTIAEHTKGLLKHSRQ